MSRQQHGYLNGCPVTGEVQQVLLAGELYLQARVQVVYPHHLKDLRGQAHWTYTGTCQDLDGSFLFITAQVRGQLQDDGLWQTDLPEGWTLERCG